MMTGCGDDPVKAPDPVGTIVIEVSPDDADAPWTLETPGGGSSPETVILC